MNAIKKIKSGKANELIEQIFTEKCFIARQQYTIWQYWDILAHKDLIEFKNLWSQVLLNLLVSYKRYPQRKIRQNSLIKMR